MDTQSHTATCVVVKRSSSALLVFSFTSLVALSVFSDSNLAARLSMWCLRASFWTSFIVGFFCRALPFEGDIALVSSNRAGRKKRKEVARRGVIRWRPLLHGSMGQTVRALSSAPKTVVPLV